MFIICYIIDMILQELLIQLNWNCIWNRMIELYPDQLQYHDQYETIINACKTDTPVPSDMRILLRTIYPTEVEVKNGIDELPWVEVYGNNGITIRESEDLNYNNWLSDKQLDEEVSYALDYTPWNKWIGMEVDSTVLSQFTPLDIAVHCLWEMTFVSFREAERDAELRSIKEDIKKIDSGEMKMYTTEEVFSRIREKLNLKDD